MSRKVRNIGAALARTNKPVEPITAGDGLQNIIAGVGTDRDKRSYTCYAFPRVLTRFELENMFRGSWVSKRIITAVPDSMTREWRRFVLSDDDNNPQIEALEKEEKKLCVAHKFKEAMYWARLYGGSAIILGMKDTISAADMLKPLVPETVKQGDLKYMHVVDRWRFAPSGKMDGDLMSPNFGKPLTYLLAESSVEVHWTRILRFNGQALPYFAWMSNGMWDDSELQHVFDSISNYDTSTSAITSMLFEANIDVVTIEGLTEALSTKEGESKIIKRMQLSQMSKSYNRTLVLDSNETYEKKQNQFASIDKIWQQFMVDVSAASHIAMSVLFGVQSGGLDSGGDDDLRNYYDFVAEERTAKCQPQLDYFDEIFVRHTLGNKPDDYSSEWNPLWQVDGADQATIDYQNAQRDQIYLTTGVVTEGLVASELKARGTYRSMSDEDVQLAEELAESMDDHEDTTRQQQQEAGAIANDNAKQEGNGKDKKVGGKNAKKT